MPAMDREARARELERLLRIAREAGGPAATNPDCPWMPAPDSGCPVCGEFGPAHPAIEAYLREFPPDVVRGLLDELMYMFDRESG